MTIYFESLHLLVTQLKAAQCKKKFVGNTEACCWQCSGAGMVSIHLSSAAGADHASISVPKEALTLPVISQLFTCFLVAQAVMRILAGSQACPPSHSSPCTTPARSRPGTEPVTCCVSGAGSLSALRKFPTVQPHNYI